MTIIFFILLVCASLVAKITAECANACNGHGKCTSYDMCICNRNWQANDCSERICQFGLAHVDTPKVFLIYTSKEFTTHCSTWLLFYQPTNTVLFYRVILMHPAVFLAPWLLWLTTLLYIPTGHVNHFQKWKIPMKTFWRTLHITTWNALIRDLAQELQDYVLVTMGMRALLVREHLVQAHLLALVMVSVNLLNS